MTYISTIHQRSYSIDINKQHKPTAISLNGVSYTLDWRQIATLAADSNGQSCEGGRYSLLIGGKSYEIFARRLSQSGEKNGQTYEILLAGQRFEVIVEDERTRMLTGLTRTGVSSSAARIQAPMPGLVANVLLEQGASVEQGQTVIILEAMKMENDLVSPIAGTIKEVKVSKGQTVDQGAVLVLVEGHA
ncbi:MAG TPA: biotin/lipoyl-containing protein [Ktedonobacteraceae bacterium]|nr:biotin/lipoyl-containing protein [Ktedonobacteraceae bacterium]